MHAAAVETNGLRKSAANSIPTCTILTNLRTCPWNAGRLPRGTDQQHTTSVTKEPRET